jgi:hypothetical protein
MKLNSFSFSSKVCIAAMLFVFTACAMESTYEKPDTLLSGYDKVNTSSGSTAGNLVPGI